MNDRATISRVPWATIGFIGIALGVAALYAGNSLSNFSFRLLVDGILLLVWLAGIWGIGAAVVNGLIPRGCPSSLRSSASFAMGIGITSTATLLLGWMGAMSEVAGWGMLVVGLAISLLRAMAWIRSKPERVARSPDRWWLLILAPLLGIVLVAAFVPPGVLWGIHEPNGYDVVEYHLQIPREWYEAGKIAPLTHNVFSYFPFLVEMQYLLAMHIGGGVYSGMYLAQLMHAAMIVMSVVATHGIAQSLNRPGWLAALACGAAPWMMLLAPLAYNEGGLLLFGTLAIGLIVQQLSWRCTVLAGIFAGFACASKLTAAPFVIAFPLLSIISFSIRKAESRRILLHAVLFAGVALAVFSPWLVRNIAWAGNPVFPEATSLLGRGHFSEDQVERWRRAHSPGLSQVGVAPRLKAIVEQVIADFRFAYVLVPLAVVAAFYRRSRENWIFAMLLLLMLVFWIGWTHLQGRFLVLMIPLSAILLAGLPRPRWVAAAIALAAIGCWGEWQVRYYRSDNEFVGSIERAARLQILGIPLLDSLKQFDATKVGEGRTLVLVGDAAPFWFSSIPMNRLRYRTVFDVDARDRDVVAAWCDWPEPLPPDAVIVVDPNELIRFSKTYWKIPPPTTAIQQRGEPFVLER